MVDLPELATNLACDLGKLDVMLTSDMSIEDANRLWLSRAFWKKFQDVLSPDCNSKALSLFLSSNERCRNYKLEPKSVFEEQLIGEVKTILDGCFFRGPEQLYDLTDLMEGCGTGPGASLGVSPPNFYSKLFDSNLSSTSETLYRLYRYAISRCPTWESAEVARQDKFGHTIVVGNRLSYAPKTSEISRPICTEPVLNMFFQKGIGSIFEQVLRRRFKIDISVQPEFNRRLAKTGSLSGACFGTIDLSSASDSIALHLLKEILPSYVFAWLNLSRSPTVTLPGGRIEELYMVSSMGNGFTFPLETIIFASIVVACYRILGVKTNYARNHPANFAVFGDDIIVRKDCYAFVVRALELFGFIVNEDKSFNYGHFRESCGGDFFMGTDIRGVYLKSLKTSADVYSIINRLIRWSVRTKVLLPRTIAQLKKSVKYLPIPFADGDAEGIKVPFPPIEAKICPNTGAVIYSALIKSVLSFGLPGYSNKLVLESETSDVVDVKGRRYPQQSNRRRRNVFYNADGIIVALVGGFIRGGRITLRESENRGRFKVRRRMTSSWRISLRTAYSAGFLNSQGDDWEVISALYLY